MDAAILLKALVLTVIIEAVVIFLLTRSAEWVKFSLYVNLVTNPLLNLGLQYYFMKSGSDSRLQAYIIGEALVYLVEAILYRLLSRQKPFHCIMRSVIANTVSVVLGGLLLRWLNPAYLL